jgi:hypothetical protein
MRIAIVLFCAAALFVSLPACSNNEKTLQSAEVHTRLAEGELTELVPSPDYRRLLPYVGEKFEGDNILVHNRMYGLVTESGMIVTDPVFSNVKQGDDMYSLEGCRNNKAAFDLEKEGKHAACALDGSWVTPFDYQAIYFVDDAILLIRDSKTNDVDIMDYNGKLLLNTKSLGCYNDIASDSASLIATDYGEGILAVPINNGGTAYVDVLSGKEKVTEYGLIEKHVGAFSDGMAVVSRDGLCGYIDRDFNLVIEPCFIGADPFYHGKAAVCFPDRSYAVIDKEGNILLESEEGIMIQRQDADSFLVTDSSPRYYDDDLQLISAGSGRIYWVKYDGYFYTRSLTDITLMKDGLSYELHGISGVNDVAGNMASVSNVFVTPNQEGVVTLDGKWLYPLTDNARTWLATSEKTGKTYAVIFSHAPYEYTVIDENGYSLFSGNGSLDFLPDLDLFAIERDTEFAYVDPEGNYVFRRKLTE